MVALSLVPPSDAHDFLQCPDGEQFVNGAVRESSEFKSALKSVSAESLAPCISEMLKAAALNEVLETFLGENPDYMYELVKLEPNRLIELGAVPFIRRLLMFYKVVVEIAAYETSNTHQNRRLTSVNVISK